MKKKPADSHLKKQKPSLLSKKAVMWTTVGFLVSLWMFVLGLLVGRGTAPVRFDIHKLQKELAGLKKATMDKTTQRYRIAFEEFD
jgi:purine-cytosine permease-like protein